MAEHRRSAKAALLLGIAMASLCGALSPAHAVDYRWTLGYAMGTQEAIIRNASGASLNIYCPAGQ